MAEEIHLRWMKSLRDEIPLRGEKDSADLISSEALAEDFIRASTRISSWLCHDFILFLSSKTILQLKKALHSQCFFQLNPPMAEEIHLRRMKSLRDEIASRGERCGGFNFI